MGLTSLLTECVFRAFRDSIRKRQVNLLPHWIAPVACTLKGHPAQSYCPDTGPTGLNNERRQGNYLYQLLKTFGRCGRGSTFLTAGGRSATESPRPEADKMQNTGTFCIPIISDIHRHGQFNIRTVF